MKKHEKKELERLCRFCESAHFLQEDEQVLCDRIGIVLASYCCRNFQYDPLKRDPGAPRLAPVLEYVSLDSEDKDR